LKITCDEAVDDRTLEERLLWLIVSLVVLFVLVNVYLATAQLS
jgi:hypothetical protein